MFELVGDDFGGFGFGNFFQQTIEHYELSNNFRAKDSSVLNLFSNPTILTENAKATFSYKHYFQRLRIARNLELLCNPIFRKV